MLDRPAPARPLTAACGMVRRIVMDCRSSLWFVIKLKERLLAVTQPML